MEETLYQTADARVYQTADAGDTLSDSGCRYLYIRQRMQKLCLRQRMQESIGHRMQETLYQTADAGDTLSDR